jgi:hypothetical protein
MQRRFAGLMALLRGGCPGEEGSKTIQFFCCPPTDFLGDFEPYHGSIVTDMGVRQRFGSDNGDAGIDAFFTTQD